MPERRKVTILTPCYNEAENVQALYERVRGVFEPLAEAYEHLFIDNASTDRTVDILREIASGDRNVKVTTRPSWFSASSPTLAGSQAGTSISESSTRSKPATQKLPGRSPSTTWLRSCAT